MNENGPNVSTGLNQRFSLTAFLIRSQLTPRTAQRGQTYLLVIIINCPM